MDNHTWYNSDPKTLLYIWSFCLATLTCKPKNHFVSKCTLSIESEQKSAYRDLGRALRCYGIPVNEQSGVGKKMGYSRWIHKDYLSSLSCYRKIQNVIEQMETDFEYHIVRFSIKQDYLYEIGLIQCPDFDHSHEPIVGDCMKILLSDIGEVISYKMVEKASSPSIYHHKWLFVGLDYSGFSVIEAMERSLAWKKKLGMNRNISSRIGRAAYWDKWLKENNLPPRIPDQIQ